MNSIEKQFLLIRAFMSHRFFAGDIVTSDPRILPFLCGDQMLIQDMKKLSSFNLCIPDSIGTKLGKWYPEVNSHIFPLYEKLSKIGLELDIVTIPKKEFYSILENSYLYKGIKVSFHKSDIFRSVEDYHKDYLFHQDIRESISQYLPVIKSDSENIDKNMSIYHSLFHKYIHHKKRILAFDTFVFKNELIQYFLDYRIFEFKVRYKFYKTLYDFGYSTLGEVFSGKLISSGSIRYDTNISIREKKYIGDVHKVFNKYSSQLMQEGKIMIAQDTNPEFIDAFYKAKIICVETNSELSHAAITCRELGIPLALGAKNVFLSTINNQSIQVDTKKQIIHIEL